MGLRRRDVILACVCGFISWGFIVSWFPIARYLGYTFICGFLVALASILSLILLTVKGNPSRERQLTPTIAFLAPDRWAQDVLDYRQNALYQPDPLYPQSPVVSEAINELLSLVSRDFVSSWYRTISKNPVFVNEVDRAARVALGNLRDILLSEDVVSIVVSRIVPILTTHLKEFDSAERAVRGKNLTRSVTESEELNLAIAGKYREGRLHPAVAVSFGDQTLLQQDYIRKVVVHILPQLLPDHMLSSRAASVLIAEMVACAVLLPVVTLLSDPDSWNQLMEAYGHTALQDRKTVRKLRAALDEHASPVPKSKHGQPFPKLSPNDSERSFERFVRAIRRCNNLSDARRFRAHITSQLKRESMVDGQDQVYLRRLETGKRVLDQKVAKLSTAGGTSQVAVARTDLHRDSANRPQEVSLVDVMHNASGISYFMEFMDRQQLMSLVQFWIVVDGIRNPLEDDFGDETSPELASWTPTDVSDMMLIRESYLSKAELKVPEESRKAVKTFLSAGKKATPEQYRKARTAILTAQSAVLGELEHVYYPKFKQSDLYYKYLASDEVAPKRASVSGPALATGSSPTLESSERRQLPPLMSRTMSHPGLKSKDLRRVAVSSNDVRNTSKLGDDAGSSRRSFESDRSAPLFDDDYDTDPLAMSTHSIGRDSQNGDSEVGNSQLIKTMEAALNDIITSEPKNGKADDLKMPGSASPFLFTESKDHNSPRSSLDAPRVEPRMVERAKPSIASLGLVDPSSRIGVFDDELFPDEKKFIEDEYADPEDDEKAKDPSDEIHEAAPGDLGLVEAVAALTEDIEKLVAQGSVLDALTRKAELTNNTAELRILGKSTASIQREIRRKEMQKQQYIIQESDNSLYGRSTLQIKSIMVGKEEDGREFAICKQLHSFPLSIAS